MAKIKQLSHHEAQKIAAGEVIERPANIVKELIENSIDAGATTIIVYIEDAGKQLIRIVDNGCGMDKHDAQICFNRHATSKITHVDELETINTFGFRGEALASIAAVSKITLITKEEHIDEGIHIDITANTINNMTPIACSTGTDITITDLFFNVPARKKFLKSSETEWRAIQQLFNAFCFDYIHIRFTLYSNNKQVSHIPIADSLKNRALQLWEPSLNHHLISIEKKDDQSCIIEGIISDHQYYRYDKSTIYFFVNKRWIKNHQLTNALIKGYSHVIPEGRYPIATIHISVPQHEIDINIHPRKEEVKFLHPRKIEHALQQLVKIALEKNLSHHIKKEVLFQPTTNRYSAFNNAQEKHNNISSTSHFTPFNFDAFFLSNTKEIKSTEGNIQKQTDINDIQPFIETHTYRIIGQYNKTYIIIEKEDGLFLIDQHAAHERILYELFAHKFHDIATVQLLFPHTIELSIHDIEIILPYIEIFNSYGIILEQCSNNQFIVQALPIYLKDQSIDSLVKEMIGWIIENKSLEKEEFKKRMHHALQAQMACKAAVKAGDELTHEKMAQLLHDLEKTANRFSCPHGRPTGWLLSLHEIEKKFKRKL